MYPASETLLTLRGLHCFGRDPLPSPMALERSESYAFNRSHLLQRMWHGPHTAKVGRTSPADHKMVMAGKISLNHPPDIKDPAETLYSSWNHCFVCRKSEVDSSLPECDRDAKKPHIVALLPVSSVTAINALQAIAGWRKTNISRYGESNLFNDEL